jgi:hypothetical protein
MAIAEHNWTIFDGWSAARGVDPMALALDRFLNLMYFFATENAEEDEKNKFDIQLYKPTEKARLTGAALAPGSPWSKENEEAALAGFAAALGGAS